MELHKSVNHRNEASDSHRLLEYANFAKYHTLGLVGGIHNIAYFMFYQ